MLLMMIHEQTATIPTRSCKRPVYSRHSVWLSSLSLLLACLLTLWAEII